VRLFYENHIEIYAGVNMGSDAIPTSKLVFLNGYTIATSLVFAFSRTWTSFTLSLILICAPTVLFTITFMNIDTNRSQKITPSPQEDYVPNDEDSNVYLAELELERLRNTNLSLKRTESVSAFGVVRTIKRRGSGTKRAAKNIKFLITVVIFDHLLQFLVSIHSLIVLSMISKVFAGDEEQKFKSLLISSEDSVWQISILNVIVHFVLLLIILFVLNLKFGDYVQTRATFAGMIHYYIRSILYFSFLSWLLILCCAHVSSGTDWTFGFDWIGCSDIKNTTQVDVFEWVGCD
jgi:hypothetical protein